MMISPEKYYCFIKNMMPPDIIQIEKRSFKKNYMLKKELESPGHITMVFSNLKDQKSYFFATESIGCFFVFLTSKSH